MSYLKGGLVIAPKIHIAEYMAEILELLTGKKPVLVHSKMDNAEEKLKDLETILMTIVWFQLT